jgi:hypothetical protein
MNDLMFEGRDLRDTGKRTHDDPAVASRVAGNEDTSIPLTDR